ncbi:U1 small nuclear ribonucleoprotein 70 kDa [Entamoeba marina]
MVYLLPKHLSTLFVPSQPIPPMPSPKKKWFPNYSGVSDFVKYFDDNDITDSEFCPIWTKAGLRKKRQILHEQKNNEKIKEALLKWDPIHNVKATDNPNRTVFVGSLPKDISQTTLERLFTEYGEVKNVVLVKDEDNKLRGYAFIEYAHRREAERACQKLDGKRFERKHLIVEMEKGRIDPTFKPKRLGGLEKKTNERSFHQRDSHHHKHVDERRDHPRFRDDKRDNFRNERRDSFRDDRRDDRYRDDRYRDNRYRDDRYQDEKPRDDRYRDDRHRDDRRRDDRYRDDRYRDDRYRDDRYRDDRYRDDRYRDDKRNTPFSYDR